MNGTHKFQSIDEYFDTVAEEYLPRLLQLREAIRQAAPKATEVISYNMPAFKQHKVLVYFAAHKNHIGFYPTAAPMIVFKNELAPYQTSKGAVQFPLDKPLPLSLIKKIVKYRLAEDQEKASIRMGNKK